MAETHRNRSEIGRNRFGPVCGHLPGHYFIGLASSGLGADLGPKSMILGRILKSVLGPFCAAEFSVDIRSPVFYVCSIVAQSSSPLQGRRLPISPRLKRFLGRVRYKAYVPCVRHKCFRAGDRASGPDFGRILFGKASNSALGRPEGRF